MPEETSKVSVPPLLAMLQLPLLMSVVIVPTLTLPRNEFFAYDVIFLGDMPAATLSTRFCEMTKEFVGKFGGGLVVLAGPRFGPGPETAVIAGFVVWLLACLWRLLFVGLLGLFEPGLLVLPAIWGLAEMLLAALADKRSTQYQPRSDSL